MGWGASDLGKVAAPIPTKKGPKASPLLPLHLLASLPSLQPRSHLRLLPFAPPRFLLSPLHFALPSFTFWLDRHLLRARGFGCMPSQKLNAGSPDTPTSKKMEKRVGGDTNVWPGAEWDSGAEAWKPSWNTICGRSAGGVPATQTHMYSVFTMGGCSCCAHKLHPTVITCINVNVFARIRV